MGHKGGYYRVGTTLPGLWKLLPLNPHQRWDLSLAVSCKGVVVGALRGWAERAGEGACSGQPEGLAQLSLEGREGKPHPSVSPNSMGHSLHSRPV